MIPLSNLFLVGIADAWATAWPKPLAVTLNCADAELMAVADTVALPSGTRTAKAVEADDAEDDTLTGRILTTLTDANDDVGGTIVCKSALSNTLDP